MNSEELDTAFERWLHKQTDNANCNFHVQVKLWTSEVEMAQLTAMNTPGWVVIDWQHRGLGLSSKRAVPITTQHPVIARLLDALDCRILHAQFQVMLAPAEDWANSYSLTSLVPDLLPVLDAGHARVLNVSSERDRGDWRLVQAHQPPSDEPIADFASGSA